MRRSFLPGLVTALAMGAITPMANALGAQTEIAPESDVRERRVIRVPSSSSPRRYRSRWKADRPRKHRNRLHISRRVRRKHRRARKAS